MIEPSAANAPPPLCARLLGATRLSLGDQPIPERAWSGRAARSLLLLLFATPGHRLPRDRVLDLLWPEAAPGAATNALYKAAHALRRTLEPDLRSGRSSAYLSVGAETVGLTPLPGTWVDADEFEELVGRAGTLEPAARRAALAEALSLYQGDFLADEPYADWPVPRREALRHIRESATLVLARLDRDAGTPLASVAALESLLAADPTVEEAHRALMRAYAAAGQRERAVRQYQRCRAALADELGVEPAPETAALGAEIEAMAVAPALSPSIKPAPFFNLPASPSPLIGRDAEVEAVQTLLWRQDVRLVTLTGAGGIGKTRLALEVAAAMREEFPDGVAFVSLAAVRDPALVADTIAQTLDVRDEGGRAVDKRLHVVLAEREMLLVLDNFEQVLPAAPMVAELLAHCHRLKIAATSREPLQLRWEHEFAVRPLLVPNLARLPAPASLSRFGAVALLERELRRARPEFAITADQAAAVAEICVRLDGLPLAIELAAARGRHLAPPALLAQLGNRLAALTGGPRDLPERQRTLRDTIAWSYDLLTADEQTLFRRLAVFAGGFTLEAAEAVTGSNELRASSFELGTTPPKLEARSSKLKTRHLLVSLIEKSLLTEREDGDGAVRFQMLETVREFARERLDESGEADAIDGRQAAWVLAFVEQAEPKLIGSAQAVWLERLGVEHDNVRAALAWATANADAETACRIASALYRFWFIRGHVVEGRRWAEDALALPAPSPRTLARMLDAMGRLLDDTGETERADGFHARALAIWREIGDEAGIAASLTDAGNVARMQSDLERAWRLHEEALASHRVLGDAWGIGRNLNGMAAVATYRGEYDRAADLFAASAEVLADTADEWARATALGNAGSLAHTIGDTARSRRFAEQSLAIRRRLDDAHGIATSLFNLGTTALSDRDGSAAVGFFAEAYERFARLGNTALQAQTALGLAVAALMTGDASTAATYLTEALPAQERAGNKQTLVEGLETVARLAAMIGESRRAVTLLAACAAERETLGMPVPPNQVAEQEELVTACRDALGNDEYASAWTEGTGWSCSEATASAMDLLAREVAGEDDGKISGRSGR
ncbi:MAG TPA: BTAD domain-containing putative transcriptional regulator [Thermomicrobiales bacterium]